jgi:hypothetical protein
LATAETLPRVSTEGNKRASGIQAARRWSWGALELVEVRVMRISEPPGLGRWRRICASRQVLQEHSGIVIPVRVQIAMVDLSIGTIVRRLEAPQAAKVAPPAPPERLRTRERHLPVAELELRATGP